MNLLQAIESRLPSGYRLTDRLGTGATSLVYLAEQPATNERLVVKALHPGTLKSESISRFLREIAVMRKLSHPRIIPVLESGDVEGSLYFTMPYFGRTTLRMRLDAAGPLTVRDALLVTRDLAEALGYAHKHGVVHRDVKPENILLGDDGRAYLMDFGFANAPSVTTASAQSAEAHMMFGTPAYVSPEQVSGKRSDDWRADFYSLGVVLFEMLTAQLPFPAGSARAMMQARLEQAAPDVRRIRPDVPGDVAAIVRRNLERAPNDRYATAFHLQMAVEVALERLDTPSEAGTTV